MWIKLDDEICHHPKIVAAGPTGAWLFVGGLGYCARYLTDGFIPREAVSTLAALPNAGRLATVLVKIGLWETCEAGYRVHDYHEYQPSAEEVEDRREKRRRAGALGGRRSGDVRRELSAFRDTTAKDRARATVLLNRAIARGDVVRGPCEVCGEPNGVQGHHDDYSEPLVVRWLCVAHHADLHVALRQQTAASKAARAEASASSHAAASAPAGQQQETDQIPTPSPIRTVASQLTHTPRAPAATRALTSDQRAHRAHAFCGKVCVPGPLHAEFIRKSGSEDQDSAGRALQAWYASIDDEWTASGAPIGDDDFAFWRARWRERNGTTATAAARAAEQSREGSWGDWSEECRALHGATCGNGHAHRTRMTLDSARADTVVA